MEIKYVDESKAPPIPKKTTGNAGQLIKMIEELPAGKVAVIQPAEGQSARGIKVSVGRIASARNIKIVSWSEEGKDTVYVKRVAE